LSAELTPIALERIYYKAADAGRPIDLADARAVLTGAPTPIDIDLIRRLRRGFGRAAADALEEVLAR
jgi:hypothetical protein